MNAESKPRRRWLAFSLRELFFLTAVVALAVGWYLDHMQLVKSEGFRVGNGVLGCVQSMYEEETPDPMPISFCTGFVKRPFAMSLSISEYYANHPNERKPMNLSILPLSP